MPGCFHSFPVGAEPWCFVVIEDIEGQPSQDCEILGSIVFAFSAPILVELYVQYPMLGVFDAPMAFYRSVECAGEGMPTGEIIPVLVGFVAVPDDLGLDLDRRLESSAGVNIAQIAIYQHLKKHLQMVRGASATFVVLHQHRNIHSVNHVGHNPSWVVCVDQIAQSRREQKHLIRPRGLEGHHGQLNFGLWSLFSCH